MAKKKPFKTLRLKKKTMQLLMKKHSDQFNSIDEPTRAAYHLRKQVVASTKRKENKAERAVVAQKVQKLLEEQDKSLSKRPPLKIASAAWDEADLVRCAALLSEGTRFTTSHVTAAPNHLPIASLEKWDSMKYIWELNKRTSFNNTSTAFVNKMHVTVSNFKK